MTNQELLDELNRELREAQKKVTWLETRIVELEAVTNRDAAEHYVERSETGPTVTEKFTSPYPSAYCGCGNKRRSYSVNEYRICLDCHRPINPFA